MKKYVWLALGTVAALVGVWLTDGWLHPEPPTVATQVLQAQPIEQTVMCSGRVQTGDTDNIYMKLPCVAQTVYVEKGDAVKKGDVLFTVDTEATLETLASSGQTVSKIDTTAIDTTVTAPINGVVDSITVQEGDVISSAKPCVVISSNEQLQVKVEIGEQDVKYIKTGQPVHIHGVAFSKDTYAGTVVSVSSTATEQYSGTATETIVEAVVEIDPTEWDDSLRLGLTATTDIVVDSEENGLIVPYDCVLQDEQQQEYVYVYQRGRAIKRVIETGWELRDGFQVVSGLSAGERIITEPAVISEDGMSVQTR